MTESEYRKMIDNLNAVVEKMRMNLNQQADEVYCNSCKDALSVRFGILMDLKNSMVGEF